MMNIRKFIKDFSMGMAVIAFYFVASTFEVDILNFFYPDFNRMPVLFLILFDLLYQALLIGIVIRIYWKEIKSSFIEFKKKTEEYLKPCAKYLLISFGLVALCNTLVQIFISDGIAKNEESVRSLTFASPIYALILILIFAPILEELIFRFAIRKLCGKANWLFIFLSGFAFGLIHVFSQQDYWYLVSYSIPGCIMAYAYVKSDNIFVSISMHAINNCFAISMVTWLNFISGLLG